MVVKVLPSKVEKVIMSMPEFSQKFRELFPDLGAPNTFLDPLLSVMDHCPRLNPVALDDAIIVKHGEYEGSMREFVGKQYGAKAVAFVLSVM